MKSAEMMAQYIRTAKKIKIVEYYEDDKNTKFCGKLIGKIIIDATNYDDKYYEISTVRFHSDNYCIELTLHSYGYKFEEHYYDWIVSHIHKKNIEEEYEFRDFMIGEDIPKYDILM